MNMAQVRCDGCNKPFTPSGLSQHIAKTPNARCHSAYGPSQAQLVNICIARTPASSIAPNPSVTPWIDTPGDNQIEDALDNSVDDQVDAMDAEPLEPLETTLQQEASHLPAISDNPVSGQPTRSFIIDHFPIGSAGAPIAGPHDTSPTNEPSLAAPGEPIWAPFRSQCDWEFARWAKMSGPTSSAITDLLAIPEVCAPYHLDFSANML